MSFFKKKIFSLNLTLFLLFILFLIFLFMVKNLQKDKDATVKLEPISINLLANVHPNLPWNFRPVKPNMLIKPGEITTVEYVAENLGSIETTGIATFAYFPKEFGSYISKINCFCYDAKTLKPKQKDKYTLVLLIDPEVTKDSKTKNIKKVTIQFTFFDYKEYNENKS